MLVLLSRLADTVRVLPLDESGVAAGPPRDVPVDALPAVVREVEERSPRWVWDDTRRWYPALLRAGVRVHRCLDLRLSHAILKGSALSRDSTLARSPADWWDVPAPVTTPLDGTGRIEGETLFALGEDLPLGQEETSADPLPELRRQLLAWTEATDPERLRLLLWAESVGALIAAEMEHAGLPWRRDVHDAILTDLLGPRPRPDERPRRLAELAAEIRAALDSPRLNPDSQPHLLAALRRVGLGVQSTRSREIRRLEHPVVAPLMTYKKLSRLMTANGWNWLDAWVRQDRFRPDYVVGGVVTGRWATSGGGALQLPREVRPAVVADPGWRLVVADASQLEPRILAGLAGDLAMARAGQGGDLYQGMADRGTLPSRAHAKVAMLGAMYGSTRGQSALLMPQLRKAFPRAIELVEQAARTGERGESVTTRLGRSSPAPDEAWRRSQEEAFGEDATQAQESRARTSARAWGRFSRNFVVQGTAAEWALCWMGVLRRRLWDLADELDPQPDPGLDADAAAAPRTDDTIVIPPPGARTPPRTGGGASEPWTEEIPVPSARSPEAVTTDGLAPAPFRDRPHLVFFLHDEVVVHTPAAWADRIAQEIVDAAVDAGKLLFGDFPVDFPLTVRIADSYAEAAVVAQEPEQDQSA